MALPISTCGLRFDNKAVRIAAALRLGSELCSPHICRCGSLVEASGTHGFGCKQAPSRVLRYHALNCISHAFSAAGIPVTKEPAHLALKGPDGCTIVPWRGGKRLAWDVTVCTTVANSYVAISSRSAEYVVEQAADRKCQKYAEMSAAYDLPPVAVKTHGTMEESTVRFLGDLGQKISERLCDQLESHFLLQWISVLIQRFNSILFHETFSVQGDSDAAQQFLFF